MIPFNPLMETEMILSPISDEERSSERISNSPEVTELMPENPNPGTSDHFRIGGTCCRVLNPKSWYRNTAGSCLEQESRGAGFLGPLHA